MGEVGHGAGAPGASLMPLEKHFYQFRVFFWILSSVLLASSVHAQSLKTVQARLVGVEMLPWGSFGQVLTATVAIEGAPPETPSDFSGHAGLFCIRYGEKVIGQAQEKVESKLDKLAVRLSWVEAEYGLARKKQHWIWVYKVPGCNPISE